MSDNPIPNMSSINRIYPVGVAADTIVNKGNIAVTTLTTGRYVQDADNSADLFVLGRFMKTVDNTGGAAGAKTVGVELLNTEFCLQCSNDPDYPVTAAHLFKTNVYLKAGNMVSADDNSNTAVSAGRVLWIDDDGIVHIKPPAL